MNKILVFIGRHEIVSAGYLLGKVKARNRKVQLKAFSCTNKYDSLLSSSFIARVEARKSKAKLFNHLLINFGIFHGAISKFSF